jgi:hypothetical protein
MGTWIVALSLLAVGTATADSARINKLKGTATFNGKTLFPDSVLEGEGNLIVGDRSYLKLTYLEGRTALSFGANTTVRINFALAPREQEVTLIRGVARWFSGPRPGKGVRTLNAAMGIRGTDFLASYNPLLDETELICFDGAVQLTNAADAADAKTVGKNQWGGIGGRFGKRLSEILDLGPELVGTFDASVPK